MRDITSIRVFIITVSISVTLSVPIQRIHEIMTREELVQTFGRHDKLPEYEVVPIYYSHLNKRSADRKILIDLNSFGRNLHLLLAPVDGVLVTDTTSVYGISSRPDSRDVIFAEYVDALKNLRPYVYADHTTNTTLAVGSDSNRQIRSIGMIGSENLVISPVQERLISTVMRQRRSIDDTFDSNYTAPYYHIVFKRSVNQIFKPFQYSLRTKRAVPDTVYPEILVIVDYNLYKMFNQLRDPLLLYVIAFWNGVDLLYQPFQYPKFRLNIASIIIAEDDYALSFVTLNKVEIEKLKCKKSLADAKSWLYEKIPTILNNEDYDVVVTMTPLDLCDPLPNNTCLSGPIGVSEPTKVCEVDDHNREISKTAIITDFGTFDGTFIAAHELGHLFGAEHDGEGANIRCPAEAKTIMNPRAIFDYKGGLWSECSLTQIQKLLETKECLLNKPHSGRKSIRILPGQLMDANEQCRIRAGTNAIFTDPGICVKLWCYNYTNRTLWQSIGPALDGTSCGHNKICVHSRCVVQSIILNS